MRFWRQYVETEQNSVAVVGEVTSRAESRAAVLGVLLAFR